MPEQLALSYNDRWQDKETWSAILAELQRVVDAIGLKQVAFDLDVQPSALSHALAERDRHYVRAEWIPYLVAHSPDDVLVALLAGIRNLEVHARRELTPAEKCDRFERELERYPEEFRRAFKDRAGLP